MTKTFVLAAVACLSVPGGFAQVKNAPADTAVTLTISIGPSTPAGAFASKNGTDLSSGLANIGELAALSWWQPIRRTPFPFWHVVAIIQIENAGTLLVPGTIELAVYPTAKKLTEQANAGSTIQRALTN